jgi:threonyl-tRNA synthetase
MDSKEKEISQMLNKRGLSLVTVITDTVTNEEKYLVEPLNCFGNIRIYTEAEINIMLHEYELNNNI